MVGREPVFLSLGVENQLKNLLTIDHQEKFYFVNL